MPVTGRVLIAAIVAALTVPAGHAADPQPIHWTLSAKAPAGVRLSGGTSLAAILRVTIEPGWHLYSMDQEAGGPTPMVIRVPSGHSFVLSGKIAPKTPAQSMTDPNFNIETTFYEGNAEFMIPLKATAAPSTPSQRTVFVDVLYQTCNDRMCLPATVAHLSTPLPAQK